MLRIFLWEIGMFCWDLPINTKGIIDDADATISLWMIEVITLVLEDCCFWEDCETMGKALWDEELAMIVFCQFYCHMLAISRGAFALKGCRYLFTQQSCDYLSAGASSRFYQSAALTQTFLETLLHRISPFMNVFFHHLHEPRSSCIHTIGCPCLRCQPWL